MAGRPYTRAKRDAERQLAAAVAAASAGAAAASGTSPSVEPLSAPAPQQAHAHTRTRTSVSTGPVTRGTLDGAEAAELAQLQAQLAPRRTVRLTRTSPRWAAGWIEDYQLRAGKISELLEYVRDEHGGALYTITVLGRDECVLYTTEIPIAGAVRRGGRPITREQWEGVSAERVLDARPQQTAAPSQGAIDPLAMVRMFLELHERSSGQITTAIRELQTMHTRQTETLVQAVMEQRSAERTSTSLAGQLREVAAVTQQVDEIRAAIVASAPQPAEQPAAPSPMQQMTADIFKTAIENEMRARAPAQRPAPSAPRPQQQQQRLAAVPTRRPGVEPLSAPPQKGAAS